MLFTSDQNVVIGVVAISHLPDLLSKDFVQYSLDLGFTDSFVVIFVDALKLFDKEAFELLIIGKLVINSSAIVAFVDQRIVPRYECIQKYFVIKGVNRHLLFLFLLQEKVTKDAFFDGAKDKYAYLILRQRLVL